MPEELLASNFILLFVLPTNVKCVRVWYYCSTSPINSAVILATVVHISVQDTVGEYISGINTAES